MKSSSDPDFPLKRNTVISTKFVFSIGNLLHSECQEGTALQKEETQKQHQTTFDLYIWWIYFPQPTAIYSNR